MPDEIPSPDFLSALTRRQVRLNPEKFGVMGTYSREMLEAAASPDMAWAFAMDMLAVRLTTTVLSGRTVSREPQVELNLPANWWQHLKYQVQSWRNASVEKKDHLGGFHRDVLLVPAYAFLSWFFGKRPVKWTKVTAKIHFEQHILYPEVDAPAQAGRPVIYEEMSISWPDGVSPYGGSLNSSPSRFMNRHEIISEIARSTDPGQLHMGNPAHAAIYWLERHGVNVDQLVKRR